MSKIRINHLARELGVKSKAILSVLPLVGITKKKNHSNSLRAEEAARVRAYFPARATCPECRTRVQADVLALHVGSRQCVAFKQQHLASKQRRKTKSMFVRIVSGGLPDTNRRKH
jgi:hypothetical protein